ncbi:hypothetical protein GF318_01825 [Candidatus Micrarchaeota archaeon]|nr:hypothetical protein [Candidatus Micrarchaeota archaeon]
MTNGEEAPPGMVAQIGHGPEVTPRVEVDTVGEQSRAVENALESTELLTATEPLQNTERRELLEAVRMGDENAFNRRMEEYSSAHEQPGLLDRVRYGFVRFIYLEKLRTTQERRSQEAFSIEDRRLRDASVSRGLSDVSDTVREMGRLSEEHSVSSLSRESLSNIGENLSPEQRADMLRAAAEAGFPASAIFSLEQEWGLAEEPVDEDQLPPARGAAMGIQRDIRGRIEDLLNNWRQAQDEESKKRAEKQLENLVGRGNAGEAIDLLRRHGSEVDDTVRKILETEMAASRDLHQHRPERVVPSRRGA